MAQAPAEEPQSRSTTGGYLRDQMDDASLRGGRNGALAGAIVGLVLGVTVWDNWLIVVIALSFYGALLGAPGGVIIGALNSRR